VRTHTETGRDRERESRERESRERIERERKHRERERERGGSEPVQGKLKGTAKAQKIHFIILPVLSPVLFFQYHPKQTSQSVISNVFHSKDGTNRKWLTYK
jgi:hypothetical protein